MAAMPVASIISLNLRRTLMCRNTMRLTVMAAMVTAIAPTAMAAPGATMAAMAAITMGITMTIIIADIMVVTVAGTTRAVAGMPTR